ncbi:MAG: nucleoside kinase [Bacillota bacterium]
MSKDILLKDLANEVRNQYKIVVAKVNGQLKELTSYVSSDDKIEFIDLTDMDGIRIYQRGLSYLLIRATKEIYPEIELKISHSLSKGLFFEVSYENRSFTKKHVKKIKRKMKEIVKKDEDFIKIKVSSKKAKKLFNQMNMETKTDLLDYRKYCYINLYKNGNMQKYFFGYMVPSTGYLDIFDLTFYDGGIILRHPTIDTPNSIPKFVESPNIAQIFSEYTKWAGIHNCNYVSNLNNIIKNNNQKDLILLAEALHSRKIIEIADKIIKKNKRVILIAGPSSSGKTTFAKRLKTQLKVDGVNPVMLSTDDYFVSRDETPIDENGEYDFEAIEAVDLDLFNKHLNDLLQGKKVEIPSFDFEKGQKNYNGDFLQINKNQPIIIEGIHGLNPKLTFDIFEKEKFKIYISALTQLNIDKHNRIPTTDARLIRRIVRDNNYRGISVQETINRWASVRRGEEKNIFPYQEDADIMFNSAIVYELAIMKKHVEPLLLQITKGEKAYLEAKRLLKFIQYFETIDDDSLVPRNSILKEFIGGSIYR